MRFHLPVLLVKHQDDDEDDKLQTPTSNMQRINCVSAVRFLAALGIKDFPVYGLSTYGPRSSLCQAWHSGADNVGAGYDLALTSAVEFCGTNQHVCPQCCYLVDQIPAKYQLNISDTEGIRRYIAFLAKMKAHAEDLRSRFESVRDSIVEKLSTDEGRQSLQWTFLAQLKQYDGQRDSVL